MISKTENVSLIQIVQIKFVYVKIIITVSVYYLSVVFGVWNFQVVTEL